jgi:microcystin-dependent protein
MKTTWNGVRRALQSGRMRKTQAIERGNGHVMAMAVLGALSACPVAACDGDDRYIGSVCTTAATYCPRGTVEANGAVLNISPNAALYALLQNTFGGDGKTTFALPDLRGRTPVGTGKGTASDATTVTWGQYRGMDQRALTLDQMPTHNHAVSYTPPTGPLALKVVVPINAYSTSTQVSPTTSFNKLSVSPSSGVDSARIWSSTLTNAINVKEVTVTIDSSKVRADVDTAGASDPVPLRSPTAALRYCMVVTGVFPTRPNDRLSHRTPLN